MRTAAVLFLASQALLFNTNCRAAPLDNQKDEKQAMQYGYGNPMYDYGGFPGTIYGGMMGFSGSQLYPPSLFYPGSMVYPGSMAFLDSQGYPGFSGLGGTMGFPMPQGSAMGGGSFGGSPQVSGQMQQGTPMMFRKKKLQRDKSRH